MGWGGGGGLGGRKKEKIRYKNMLGFFFYLLSVIGGCFVC